MIHSKLLACCGVALLLAGCGPVDDGYYDANGNYIPPVNNARDAQRHLAPEPGTAWRDRHDNNHYRSDNRGYYDDRPVYPRTDYTYDRAGYYDYNGYYIASASGLNVPKSMSPPRGMCRVWFPERTLGDQPAVESCVGIQARVPAGAYVIYGG